MEQEDDLNKTQILDLVTINKELIDLDNNQISDVPIVQEEQIESSDAYTQNPVISNNNQIDDNQSSSVTDEDDFDLNKTQILDIESINEELERECNQESEVNNDSTNEQIENDTEEDIVVTQIPIVEEQEASEDKCDYVLDGNLQDFKIPNINIQTQEQPTITEPEDTIIEVSSNDDIKHEEEPVIVNEEITNSSVLDDTEVKSVVSENDDLGMYKDVLEGYNPYSKIINENGITVTLIDYLRFEGTVEKIPLDKMLICDDREMSGKEFITNIVIPIVQKNTVETAYSVNDIINMHVTSVVREDNKKKGLFERIGKSFKR